MRRGRRLVLGSIAGVVLGCLVLGSCASVTGALGRTSTNEASGREGLSTSSSDESGQDDSSMEERLFTTPEGAVVSTPWFTVSSVILRVTRVQRETVIVLPEESVIRDYMRFDPNVVLDEDDVLPNGQLLFGLGFVTDGVPAFAADADRYRYPQLYD